MKTEGKVEQIPYTLTRRRTNKNIVIRVDEQGNVLVSAPPKSSIQSIERVISSHQKILRLRIEERKKNLHTYSTGDTFLFEGRLVSLVVKEGKRACIQVSETLLEVSLTEDTLSPGAVRAVVKQYYRIRTRERVAALLPEWAEALGLAIPPFTVRDAKRRWASCSSIGRLNFSLRCQALSDLQLSYLILHELAHLIHFDHSSSFHALLQRHMPAYKQIQQSIFALQEESQLT